MSIELVRVDFRLIHGQVITRWLTQCQINEIVTIDNELNKDPFMQEVFKMAAPKGVKITIVDDATAVAKQQGGEFDKKRVMLLFKGVEQLNAAVEVGLQLDKVQIGGLGGGPGRKAVNNAIKPIMKAVFFIHCLHLKSKELKFIFKRHRTIRLKLYKRQ